VYDLTVEKHHCYLANGVLVSNSDSFRYLSMAWRKAAPRRIVEPPKWREGIFIPPPRELHRGELVL
jgi:hypothetical protein